MSHFVKWWSRSNVNLNNAWDFDLKREELRMKHGDRENEGSFLKAPLRKL
jgi:hypothetical protein